MKTKRCSRPLIVYDNDDPIIDKVPGLRELLIKTNRCLIRLGCGHYSITDRVIEYDIPEWRGSLYKLKEQLQTYMWYKDRDHYLKEIYGVKKEIEELEKLKYKKKTIADFAIESVYCERCYGLKDPLEKLYE
jgi:hypothetical protein